MYSFEKARSILSSRVLEIVSYLFPNGKKIGHEWCVGSINGEAGSSLKIRLSGQKTGIWSDFNGGEGGDLIDLWSKKNGISLSESLKEINEYLGNKSFNPKITINNSSSKSTSTKYTLPSPKNLVPLSNNSPIRDYLITERCLTDEIINKFKISERGNDIVFPFFEDGILTHLKYLSIHRYGENKKKVISSSPNSKPILFGWQSIPNETTSIIICEGEIDAMSLAQYGLHALSVPLGAGKGAKQNWWEHEKERLEKYETIYLCFDPDEPGQQSIEDIANLFGKNRCKVVILPHKDPNECLQKGVTIEQMYEYFQKAKYYEEPKNSNVHNLYKNEIEIEGYYQNELDHKIEKIEWVWENVIAYKMVTLFAGAPGLGKSQLLLYVASTISNGLTFYGDKSPTRKNKVLLMCGEDGILNTLVPRLQATGSNPNNIIIAKGIKKVNGSGAIYYDFPSISENLESIENYIIKNECGIVIIDPFALYMGNADENKNKDIRRIVSLLNEMAERLNLAIIINTHFSKSSGNFQKAAIERVMGSIAFAAAARTVMAIIKDKDDPTRRLFIPIKNNIGNDQYGMAYKIEKVFIKRNEETVETSKIVFVEDKISITADEALSSQPREAPRLDEAKEFLMQLLSGGEMRVFDIKQKFMDAGIGMSRMYEAKNQLNIIVRTSYKDKRDKYWSIVNHGQL